MGERAVAIAHQVKMLAANSRCRLDPHQIEACNSEVEQGQCPVLEKAEIVLGISDIVGTWPVSNVRTGVV